MIRVQTLRGEGRPCAIRPEQTQVELDLSAGSGWNAVLALIALAVVSQFEIASADFG